MATAESTNDRSRSVIPDIVMVLWSYGLNGPNTPKRIELPTEVSD